MGKIDDRIVTRAELEQGLARVGLSPDVVQSALTSVQLPAPLSAVCLLLENAGFGTGELMESMGASP
jgi:hypothetical protein